MREFHKPPAEDRLLCKVLSSSPSLDCAIFTRVCIPASHPPLISSRPCSLQCISSPVGLVKAIAACHRLRLADGGRRRGCKRTSPFRRTGGLLQSPLHRRYYNLPCIEDVINSPAQIIFLSRMATKLCPRTQIPTDCTEEELWPLFSPFGEYPRSHIFALCKQLVR